MIILYDGLHDRTIGLRNCETEPQNSMCYPTKTSVGIFRLSIGHRPLPKTARGAANEGARRYPIQRTLSQGISKKRGLDLSPEALWTACLTAAARCHHDMQDIIKSETHQQEDLNTTLVVDFGGGKGVKVA